MEKIIKKAQKLEQPTIVLTGNTAHSLQYFIDYYLFKGFRVYKQGSKRKYYFFGKKKYFVILVAGKKYYEESLEVAIKLEHYEKAAEFKKKLDELNTIL